MMWRRIAFVSYELDQALLEVVADKLRTRIFVHRMFYTEESVADFFQVSTTP
jgi:hypothetical protein